MTNSRQETRASVLAAMPGTQAEIRTRTGISQAAVSRWCNTLVDDGDAHIPKWLPPEHLGAWSPHYEPGPGVNVERPGGKSARELSRISRRQRRKSGDWEDVKARERGRYWAKKPARRDPLVEALFGPYPAMAGSSPQHS